LSRGVTKADCLQFASIIIYTANIIIKKVKYLFIFYHLLKNSISEYFFYKNLICRETDVGITNFNKIEFNHKKAKIRYCNIRSKKLLTMALLRFYHFFAMKYKSLRGMTAGSSFCIENSTFV